MKRKLLGLFLALAVADVAMAGGLLTNTNQNVAFLRNPCRDASIGIDGVYNNPAGLSFLSNGWHLSLNVQSVFQTRTIDTQNPLYVNGINNGGKDTKRFEGKAQAPVAPSLQLAYVKDRWAISTSFAITGGGGKCTFDDGLGTFENVVSSLPGLINQGTQAAYEMDAADGRYSSDMYMRGKQYYYGLQLGVNYKITDNLSAYLGGRLILADCNYYGYVDNIMIGTTPQAQKGMGLPEQAPIGKFNPLLADGIRLDCDQSGWSFMTVLGLDYKLEKWNFAAKYEFYGRMHLKNQSSLSAEYVAKLAALSPSVGETLGEFVDGAKIDADVPSLLTLGVQYSFLPNLRGSIGYHHFFDKHASQYNHREKYLDEGTNEYLAGVEWDINKTVTASAGFQSTNYGFGDNSKFLKDISFTTSSCSVGAGAEIRITPKTRINLAYFHTFYKEYKNKQTGYTDTYNRTNDVIGVGLDLDF